MVLTSRRPAIDMHAIADTRFPLTSSAWFTGAYHLDCIHTVHFCCQIQFHQWIWTCQCYKQTCHMNCCLRNWSCCNATVHNFWWPSPHFCKNQQMVEMSTSISKRRFNFAWISSNNELADPLPTKELIAELEVSAFEQFYGLGIVSCSEILKRSMIHFTVDSSTHRFLATLS